MPGHYQIAVALRDEVSESASPREGGRRIFKNVVATGG
jgi:hypothetical protein